MNAWAALARALLRLRRAVFVEFCGPMRGFRLHLLPLAVVYLAGVLGLAHFLSVDWSPARLAVTVALASAWLGGLAYWLWRIHP